MEPAVLFHHAVHRSPADIDAVLLESHADAIYAVVVIIRMLCKNFFDFDRKKLTATMPVPVSKPAIVA